VTRSSTRPLVLAALVAGTLAVLYLAFGGGGSDARTFQATVTAAENIVSGQEINAGGKAVGSVTEITPIARGRAARIKMTISDPDYWPLPHDTTLEIRYGGTVSFSNRYLLLHRGKDRSRLLANGGMLAPGAVKTPVEVDQFINDFPKDVRKDFQRLLGNAAPVFEQGGPELNAVLAPDKAPLVTTGVGKLAADLTKDGTGLRTLLRSTSSVLTAADSATPELRTLLDGFAQTADAIASESENLKTTLTRFPAALRQTRRTLSTAEVTLREARGLTDELGPGVTQLRASVRPLRATLAKLREVAPLGTSALLRAPKIGTQVPMLRQLTEMVPLLKSVLDQAGTELDCLRPYSPEIAYFGTVWGDFTNPVDTKDRVVRANVQSFLPANFNSVPYTAGDAARRYPGLDYGFPRPPGELAKQPWFQPQCGITKDALDPDKDPESADFVRNGAKAGAK